MARFAARARSSSDWASLYQEITDKIIAELEAGRLPWVQPWGGAGVRAPLAMPKNAATDRRYSGINVLILWGAVVEHGFSGQSWLTFRQALGLGGHPVRRSAALSAVLARPTGYPDRITLLLNGSTVVSAYNDSRYDDVDLEWSTGLLSGEFRLDCGEGYQWVRSGRRIHIFCEAADEPGLISVGSAALRASSAIICREEDADAVRSAADACGSPPLEEPRLDACELR